MRVVLVGSGPRLERLRVRLPDGIHVVGEAATIGEARSIGGNADAFIVAAAPNADQTLPIEALTPRESEVLALLADGLSNKTIARALGISDETVKFHLTAIFGKLGASNRTDAVRRAMARGLIPL